MAKIRYDGVLETAHFKPDGQLDWVRIYLRRGSVFSDHILMSRQEFVKDLKAGKRYFTGERIPKMGGKFNIIQPVNLQQHEGNVIIVSGDARATQDELAGVPII
jgi:hypothetical protein